LQCFFCFKTLPLTEKFSFWLRTPPCPWA